MLDEGSRLAVLAAIGIDVYRLREACTQGETSGAAVALGGRSAVAEPARLVVACIHGAGRNPSLARLLPQLLRSLGVADAAARRIETAVDGSLTALPEAPAYLMIGAAAARACSAHLSIERQNTLMLVVIDDEPAIVLRDAAAKRALWQQLKPLARRLRTG
jgi:DNA polymerase III psi subunit